MQTRKCKWFLQSFDVLFLEALLRSDSNASDTADTVLRHCLLHDWLVFLIYFAQGKGVWTNNKQPKSKEFLIFNVWFWMRINGRINSNEMTWSKLTQLIFLSENSYKWLGCFMNFVIQIVLNITSLPLKDFFTFTNVQKLAWKFP